MDHAGFGDGALVAAFAGATTPAGREEAFAELVRRHGVMVIGTCRRILGNGTDAEDAAQAVFLTLAHKARSLAKHPTLGGWLHRVARNVALRQRDAARTRSRHEGNEEARAMTAPPDNLDERLRGELREVLDDALDQIAERYRVPLVLHYLEGRSQEEVASMLKLKEGTLASLLSRGRDQLRTLLERKGVAVGGLALASFLVAETGASAAVPAAFTVATIKAAGTLAGGTLTGAAAPQVILLTKGTLKAMTIVKLTTAATVAAATLVVGSVAALTVTGGEAPRLTPPVPVVAVDNASAEAAVMAAVKALRVNDGVHFLGRLSAADRGRVEEAWKGFALMNNPWVGGMLDRALTPLASGDPAQLGIAPALAHLDAQDLQRRLLELAGKSASGGGGGGGGDGGDERRRGGLAGIPLLVLQGVLTGLVTDLLAAGLESQQAQTAQELLSDLAAWVPTAGLGDPAKADLAAGAIAAMGKDVAIGSAAQLASLDLPQVSERLGRMAKGFKAALAVYGLDLDQILDSVSIAKAEAVPGAADQRLVVLAFVALGKPRSLPLKLVNREGRWQLAGDSPIAHWLRPRTNLNLGFGFGGRPPQRGGPGGGAGGGGDRGQRGGGAPPPQPQPEANPGF